MLCVLFLKGYYSGNKHYRFYPGVKYKIKCIDNDYYYTVKNVRLPKRLQNRVYKVLNIKR